MALTRDQILAGSPLPCKEINVPELGGSVFIARLSGRERDRLDFAIQAGKDRKADVRGVIAIACLCDADRKLLFGPQDLDAVSALDGIALDRIYYAALRYNKIQQSDVEELEKNSEVAVRDSTPSG